MKTIIVIMGPSGSGKTAVAEELKSKFPHLFRKVVTDTSRAPREGEVNGKDYFFRDREFFETNKELFLESTEYCGNFYGTRFEEISKGDKQMPVIVMDDVGANNLREIYGAENVFAVFVQRDISSMSKSIDKRVCSDEEKETRKKTLEQDMRFKNAADYVLENEGSFNDTIKNLVSEISKHI